MTEQEGQITLEELRERIRPKYRVIAKVISQKGVCVQGHKVGDEFVVSGKTPGMCPEAFHSALPFARALLFGGAIPGAKDPDVMEVACLDGTNPLVMELRREPLQA